MMAIRWCQRASFAFSMIRSGYWPSGLQSPQQTKQTQFLVRSLRVRQRMMTLLSQVALSMPSSARRNTSLQSWVNDSLDSVTAAKWLHPGLGFKACPAPTVSSDPQS